MYEYEPGKHFAADDQFIAKQMQPTCTGKKVDLSYRLTIQAQYGSICADLPHCTIPLVITPPPLPSFGTIQPPAGWAPQLMPILQIDQSVNLMNAAMGMAAGAANAAGAMAGAMGGAMVAPGMNVQVNMNANQQVPAPAPLPPPQPVGIPPPQPMGILAPQPMGVQVTVSGDPALAAQAAAEMNMAAAEMNMA